MKQEITNFGKFYRLLALMPGGEDREELKEKLVWQFTGCRTDSLREMKRTEYERMVESMERQTGQPSACRKRPGYYGGEAEAWRRRAIAAVFGFYRKIKEPVTLAYVKGILCRAGGETDINRISPGKMREIYNSWMMKQRVKDKVDKMVEDELGRCGYLEEGGAQ